MTKHNSGGELNRRKSAILAIALSLGLVLAGCGADKPADSADDDSTETTEAGTATEGAFTVKLSADGIEVPAEISAGVVEVTVETDIEEGEVNFTKVAAGTTEEDFRAAIASATSGGEIPALLEATAGLHGTQQIQIPEGDLFVWSDPPRGDEESEEAEGEAAAEGEEAEGGGEEDKPDPAAFIVATTKATGDAEGEIPDTGSITAKEYSFDVDVHAGEEKFYFSNEGPDQLHHVVLVDFGDIDKKTVEDNLEAFLQTEGEGEPPAALKDVDPEKAFAVGGSGVFTPGLGGTGDAKFESGNTYAAICFLQDRTGGAPHVFSKGMRTVFTVE
ncbi:MAG TPA: hypothetical protein VMY88_10060 [Acidimicrobiales bacterium]|nr:hypothetical protein [Acidimicrobiales bacterium]